MKSDKELKKPLTPFMNVKPEIRSQLDRYLMVLTTDPNSPLAKTIQITSRLAVISSHSSWLG